MTPTTDQAAKAPARELTLTRVFDSPRELVFKAWTDPKHFAKWWGPDGFTNPVVELDVRPGGTIRVCMRSPQGQDFWMPGVFREVVPPERLVFTAMVGDAANPHLEDVNTVTFTDQGGKTKVTLHTRVVKVTPEGQQFLEGMDEGWNQTLDHLGQYVGKLGFSAEPGTGEVVMMRVFDAPRSLVFEASTKCEHVKQWWGPRKYTVTECHIDLRPGGAWRFVQRGPDGNEYPFKGVYREIVRPELLVYTFIFDVERIRDYESVVTTTLDEYDGKTLLTSTQVHDSVESRDAAVQSGMESGAIETMDRLAEHLSTMS